MSYSKWKCILINWVNCYENNVKEFIELKDCKIFSNLIIRCGFDRKSGPDQHYHTVNSFINSQYPKVVFENGSIRHSSTEKDVCALASIVLYHVCVSTKNIKIKKKMCSKLSPEDQQIILKFTQLLMEKPVITYDVIFSAILEITPLESSFASPLRTPSQQSLSTPPMLKILHERNRDIKNLTAALEAEKFDRNFLQEELGRLQSKFNRLSKQNESYEKELKQLRAQLESNQSSDTELSSHSSHIQIKKADYEIEQLETKLANVLLELHEAEHNIKGLSSKNDILKKQRDEFLKQSHDACEENAWLSAQLETQTQLAAHLQDVNNELRTHLSRGENISIECDDIDSANISKTCIRDETSICGVACEEVIEIQLNEEKAKTAQLTLTNSNLSAQMKNMILLQEELMRSLIEQRETLSGQIKEQKSMTDNANKRLESLIQELDVSEPNNVEQNVNFTKKLNDIIADLVGELKSDIVKKNTCIDNQEKSIKAMEDTLTLIMSDRAAVVQCIESQATIYQQNIETFKTKYENKVEALKAHTEHLKLVLKDLSARLSAKLQEGVSEIGQLKDLIEMKSLEKAELERSFMQHSMNMEAKNECLESTIENIHVALQHEIELRHSLQSANEEMANSLNEAETDMLVYQDKCEKLLDYMKEKDVVAANLQEKIEQQRHMNDTLEIEIQNRDFIINDMEKKHNLATEQLQEKIIVLKNDYETKCTDMSLNILALQTLQKNTESDLKSKEKKLSKLTNTAANLEKELRELKTMKESLVEENSTLNRRITDKDTVLEKLNKQIEDMAKELANTSSENNILKKEIHNINVEMNALQKEYSTSKTDLNNNIEILKNSLLIEKQSHEKTLTDLKAKSMECGKNQKAIVDLRKSVSELTDFNNNLGVELNKYERMYNEIKTKSEHEETALREEIVLVKEQIKQLKDMLSCKEQDIKKLQQELSAKNEELKALNNSTVTQTKEFNEKLLRKEQDIFNCQNQLILKVEECDKLNTEVNQRTVEIKQLNKEFKQTLACKDQELMKLQEHLSAETQQCAVLNSTINKQTTEYKDMLGRKEQELLKIQSELTAKTEEHIALSIASEQETVKHQKLIEDLNNKLLSKTQELLNIQEQLSIKSGECETLIVALDQQVKMSEKLSDELNEKLTCKEKELISIQEQLKLKSVEYIALINDLEQKTTNHTQLIEELNNKFATQKQEVLITNKQLDLKSEELNVISVALDKQIETNKKLSEELNAKISCKEQEVLNIQEKLKIKIAEYTELDMSSQQKTAQNDKLIEELNTKLTAKGQEIANINKQILIKSEEIITLNVALDHLSKELQEKNEKITALNQQSETNAKLYKDLSEKLLCKDKEQLTIQETLKLKTVDYKTLKTALEQTTAKHNQVVEEMNKQLIYKEQEIADLTNKIHLLENANILLTKTNDEKVQSLESQITLSQESLKSSQEQIIEQQEINTTLVREVKDLKDNNCDLLHQVKLNSTNLVELNQKLAENSKLAKEYRSQIDALTELKNNLILEKSRLESELLKSAEEVQRLSKIICGLQDEMKQDRNAYSDKISDLVEEKNLIASESSNKIKLLDETVEKQIRAIYELESAVALKSSEISILEEHLADINLKNSELREEIANNNEKINNLRKCVGELEIVCDQFKNTNDINESLRCELEQLKSQHFNEIKTLRSENDLKVEEYESILKNTRYSLHTLRYSLHTLKAEKSSLESVLSKTVDAPTENLIDIVNYLIRSKDSLEIANFDYVSRIEKTEQDLTESTNHGIALKSNLDIMEKNNHEALQKLSDCENQLENTSRIIATKEEEISKLDQKIMELQTSLTLFMKKSTESEELIQDLKNNINSLKQDHEKDFLKERSSNENLQKSFQEKIDALEVSLAKEIKEKDAALRTADSKIVELQDSLQSKEFCLEKMIEHLKIEKESKIEYQERFDAEQSYRVQQCKAYDAEISKLKLSIIELNDTIIKTTAECENKIKKYSNQHAELQEKIDKTSEKLKHICEICENLPTKTLEVNIQLKMISDLIGVYDVPEHENMSHDDLNTETLIMRSISLLDTAIQKTTHLKTHIEALGVELNNFGSENKEMNINFREICKALTTKINHLKEENQISSEHLTVLEKTKNATEELFNFTSNAISELKSTYDKDIEELLKTLESNEVRITLMKSNPQELKSDNKADVNALENGLQTYKEVLLVLNRENIKLLQELNSHKDTKIDLELALSKLTEDCKFKESSINDLRTNIESIKAQKQESFTNMSGVINSMKIEKEALEKTISDEGILIKRVQEKNDSLTDEINELTLKLQHLTESENSLMQKIVEKDSFIVELKSSIEKIEQNIQVNEKNRESLENELKNSNSEKDLLKLSLNEKDSFISHTVNELCERLTNLSDLILKKGLKDINTINSASISDEQKILDQNDVGRHTKMLLTLENHVQCLVDRVLENEIINDKNEKQIQQLSAEVKVKLQLIQSLERDLANIELNLEQTSEKFKCALSDLSTKETNLLTLKKQLDISHEKIKAFSLENEELSDKYEKIAKICEDKNGDIEDLNLTNKNLSINLQKVTKLVSKFACDIISILSFIESDDIGGFDSVITALESTENELKNYACYEYNVKEKLCKLCDHVVTLKNAEDELRNVCKLLKNEKESKIVSLAQEVDALSKSIAHREELVKAVKTDKEEEIAKLQNKIEALSTDLVGTTEERSMTVSHMEKIILEKNVALASLQSEVAFLKTMIADSQNKILDVNKELEASKDNYESLSVQFKKTLQQKNEEIAELEKQVAKSTNTANQLVKLSARYQVIIQKRISELKTNPLKELTYLNNVPDFDSRKSLAGVTVEDLERFLEYTEKHSKKLCERHTTLQQERDHLKETCSIKEAELELFKQNLNEIVDHMMKINRIKDSYVSKMTKICTVEKNIRKELSNIEHNLNERVAIRLEKRLSGICEESNDAYSMLCKWMDKINCPEKLKQVLRSESVTQISDFQNTGLEVHIDELQNAIKRLLEELTKAKRDEYRADGSSNVLEIRSEYEEKLERMKSKMKQVYQEQIMAYREKQQLEIKSLQSELHKTRELLAQRSKSYEEHIARLTKELWIYGEKLLMEKNEVEWLRRKHSTSLMSLQNLNSVAPPLPRRETLASTHVRRPDKQENRGIPMEDEDGEIFDNRFLNELNASPRSRHATDDYRLSELKWRNSLCPPHLKSSYPTETQFHSSTFREEEIKSLQSDAGRDERKIRKEVGITAYKKPGPPTPSKAAGRLSATDSELRESMRMEPELGRKTSTPSRIRSLFRSSKHDQENSLTPRGRRLSIFRKK